MSTSEARLSSVECSCVWKGRMQGPRGWVELIDKRDPACPVHSADDWCNHRCPKCEALHPDQSNHDVACEVCEREIPPEGCVACGDEAA
jgi:hypothetical protein